MLRAVTQSAISMTTGLAAWGQSISTSEVKGAVQDPDGRAVQTGIVLQVATNPTIDDTRRPGSVSETVNVEAGAAMVETRSTGLGKVMDPKYVPESLIGRKVTDLIILLGAATLSTNPQLNTSRKYSTPAISIAGGLGSATAYVLYGSMHNDPSNGLAVLLPFPDGLQEFNLETGALPAQYGLHSAGAVSVVGPGYVTSNRGLSRSFRIREGRTLKFRAEGSNVLNTVNFGNPNTSVGTSTFGRITSTAAGTGTGFAEPGDPRIMQFAFKHIF